MSDRRVSVHYRASLSWFENMNRKTKTCPTCIGGPRERPLEEFGVNRARLWRDDGRNVYCKECVRRRMRERRAVAKARRLSTRPWINLRQPAPPAVEILRRAPLEQLVPLAPVVLEAIDNSGGACSQHELVKFAAARLSARLPRHEVQERVGHALGELFAERLIATRGEFEHRVYFRRNSFVLGRW